MLSSAAAAAAAPAAAAAAAAAVVRNKSQKYYSLARSPLRLPGSADIEYIEYRFLQDNDIRLISFSAPSHHFPRQLWAVHQDGLSPHLFQSHRRFLPSAMARWRFKLMVGFFQPAQLPTLTAEDMASEQKNDERRKQRCGAAGILIW